MDSSLQQALTQLQDAMSVEQSVSALTLAVYLLLGGAMAIYVRLLYRKFARSGSDADSVTRVFPLLTLVTIGVIAVVKSSMALSLGLVGALSIVRFRAAIKEPEELIYLFLCIGIGLALGAGLPLLAIVVLGSATLFVGVMHFVNRKSPSQSLLLTISADAESLFASPDSNLLAAIRAVSPQFSIERFDVEDDRGQLRLVLKDSAPEEAVRVLATLRSQLSHCDVSFVNLSSSL